jgi:hypothetical protein
MTCDRRPRARHARPTALSTKSMILCSRDVSVRKVLYTPSDECRPHQDLGLTRRLTPRPAPRLHVSSGHCPAE